MSRIRELECVLSNQVALALVGSLQDIRDKAPTHSDDIEKDSSQPSNVGQDLPTVFLPFDFENEVEFLFFGRNRLEQVSEIDRDEIGTSLLDPRALQHAFYEFYEVGSIESSLPDRCFFLHRAIAEFREVESIFEDGRKRIHANLGHVEERCEFA